MRPIMPDVNVQGHFRRLLVLLEGEPWREFWAGRKLAIESFEHLELPQNAPDAVVRIGR